MKNALYYGDNLTIMREHIADESVDLVYLDPPTKGMYTEADELGFFDSPSGRKIPKLQVRTIKELLEGKEFDFPKGYSLRSSGKKLLREGEQGELGI